MDPLLEERKQLQEESEKIKKRLDAITEKLYNLDRKCVIDTHTNVPHIRIVEAKIRNPIKDKTYLIGVKPVNCNVKLSLGGAMIPILNREISCRLYAYTNYAMIHDLDIFVAPIDSLQDYSVELKYSDDTSSTTSDIRDVNNHNDVLAQVIHMERMHGVKDVKLPKDVYIVENNLKKIILYS